MTGLGAITADSPLSIEEAEEVIHRVAVLPVVELDWALVRRAIDTH